MKIIRIPAGIYAANCYIIFDESTRDGIVVDPGGDVDDLLVSITENKVQVKHIILTHGHGDHIGGVIGLKKALGASVLIHELDKDMLIDGSKNLSTAMSMGSIEIEPDRLIEDGDIVKIGDLNIEVIHTPGHTLGGICLKIGNNLITGDTLFAGSIGRTDLLGGDYDTIIKSIKNKLMIYSDETIVYPGHGTSSTIGKERISNPFVR